MREPKTCLERDLRAGEQRRQAITMGMWMFLAAEVLLFAGLFALYAGARTHHADAFGRGVAHNLRWLGTLDTVLLLSSSYLVAQGVGQLSRRTSARRNLYGAAALGAVFVASRLYEYGMHAEQGFVPGLAQQASATDLAAGLAAFFNLYLVMSGAHTLHVVVGIGVLGVLTRQIRRVRSREVLERRLEVGSMYWHLLGIVWLFLWPLFYLIQ